MPDGAGVQTFLIADVRGYTRFTQEHGDEEGARLAARFAAVVREVIEANGGTVVELRGDEALCVFASPRQAVRSAVALQRRCAEELREDPSLPLRVGAGIDAGEAVAVEGGYRGGALNLAARLCSLAKGGEVLVSEGTVLLTRRVDDVEYADRGRVALKGLREPVRYFQARFPLDLPAEERARPPWWRRRVALVAAAALAALGAGLGIGLTGGGSGSAAVDENALVELVGAKAKVQAQRPFDNPPGGLAVGLGRVWVTDPVSGRVISVLPGGAAGDVALSGGHAPTAIAIADKAVWVVNTDDSTVVKLDPSLLTPVQRVRVGPGASAVAAAGNDLWVVNSDEGTVQRIDVRSGRAGPPIGVGSQPVAVATGLGLVWVADAGNGTLVQVDPKASRVVAVTPVGPDPDAVTVADGKVWIGSGASSAVVRFDPANPDAQRTIPLPGQPVALAASAGAVWVATQGGSVERIDSRTLRAAQVRRLGTPLAGLVAGDAQLWATTLSGPAKHRGGTLRVALDEPLDAIDPTLTFTPFGWQEAILTGDGLVGFRCVGGAAGTQLVPDLATAIPAPTDGGRTYRFVLRRGIRFSTGESLRASDVRRSLERALTAKGGPAPPFLSRIVGASKCRPGRACDLSAGVVTDDSAGTVTFHLTAPDSSLPYVLALPFTYPLPPSAGAPRRDKPVPAIGPYRVASVSLKTGLVLERNPRFRVWSSPAQPPGFPDRIVWRFSVPLDRQIAEVERGRLDAALGPVLQSSPRAGSLTTRFPSLAHAQAEAGSNGFFMNTRLAPFDDVRVRRAVNFALDRRRARATFVNPSFVAVSCQILPPTIAGYRPYCPYGLGGVPASGYRGPNLAEARRLVAASGTAGERVTVVSSTTARPASEYLAGVLRELGYRASVHVVGPFPVYFPYVADSRHHVQIGFTGWVADYPAPSDFLDLLFSCRSSVPGNPAATFNPSFFCDRRVERAIAVARRLQAAGSPGAPLAWARVDRLVTDLAPWAPVFTPRSLYFVARRVGDYQYNPQWGPLLGQLWVR